MEILSKSLGVVAMLGGLAAVVGYLWLAMGFVTNRDNELDAFSLLSIVTVCCPIFPFFVFRLKRPQKEPLVLLLGGIAVSLAGLGGIELLSRTPRGAEAVVSSRAVAINSGAPALPIGNATLPAPPPPSVKVPEMDGKPVDLSSVMGRARALADKWQPEATLTGIDVTQMNASAVRTDVGGKVTVTFGPSPFDPAPSGSSSFVVTYDQGGLRGAPASVRPGKALPEPMCAPERIPALSGSAGLSLRYARGTDAKPAWLVSDPRAPRTKPRVFDANTCLELLKR